MNSIRVGSGAKKNPENTVRKLKGSRTPRGKKCARCGRR